MNRNCNINAINTWKYSDIAISESNIANCFCSTTPTTHKTDKHYFGMIMPGRNFSSNSYRFGFNGQEKTDEISGNGNHNTALYWEYDTRTGRRWNRDPITFTWQSPYATNNCNPIVFTDPLGLFGSRKEAREYKKEHELKGSIHKGKDGIFSIDNKKQGTSLFRDPSTDNIPNLIGRQEDGVIKSSLIDGTSQTPSTDDYNAGIEQFGKRGMVIKKEVQKASYEFNKNILKELDINVKTSAITKGYKGLTKGIAKHAPIIGYVIDAKEVINGIQADGNALGANTAIEVAGVAGGAGGAWAGAAMGASIGSLICPGVGTVVGGVIGGVLGSWGGEEAAEGITRKALKE
ncbi:MAG: hypothetical protein WC223_11810 [Bacteroidales bacterium]|jgi:hypothetical protein